MTGIIAATQLEADLLIKRLTEKEELLLQGKLFYRGILCDLPVAVCICGVGKVNAAHGATLLIGKFNPESIDIVGVAGSYPSSGLKIGDIAVADKEVYGDEGLMVGEKFCTMAELLGGIQSQGFGLRNEFPMFIPEELKDFYRRGRFVTVSTCTGTLKRGLELEKRFDAICENMEGAAIAHVCAMNNIPATEIRGISNIIEDRTAGPINRADIMLAAENVQKLLITI